MAQIKRTITVMDLRNITYYKKDEYFEIVKLINTVSYYIGQVLSEREVDGIIRGMNATVNIVPYKD